MREKPAPPRVLIIVQNLPVPLDRRVWLEATSLRRAGYVVSVISPRQPDQARYERLEGISIYRYRVPAEAHGLIGYALEFNYCWLMTAYLSLKALRRDGFDIIQACNPPETYFLLGWVYKLFGKKFIFDHHDLSPEMYLAKSGATRRGLLYRLLTWMERQTFRTAEVVMTTNQSHRRIAIERGGVSPDRVFIVRSGPDSERLRILPPEPELKEGRRHMVCYLGEMCPQDGVDYLLRSIKVLVEDGRNDVLYVLMGGGPAQPAMRALSEEMGLAGCVKFTGRVSDEELCRYLSTADICVDPDPRSAWSDKSTMNKIMEYMILGRAIVAFDLTENRFSAQEAAVYARPNDEADFARLMAELLADDDRRTRMGAFGKKRVETALHWRHSVPALLAAYATASGRPAQFESPIAAEVEEEALAVQ